MDKEEMSKEEFEYLLNGFLKHWNFNGKKIHVVIYKDRIELKNDKDSNLKIWVGENKNIECLEFLSSKKAVNNLSLLSNIS